MSNVEIFRNSPRNRLGPARSARAELLSPAATATFYASEHRRNAYSRSNAGQISQWSNRLHTVLLFQTHNVAEPGLPCYANVSEINGDVVALPLDQLGLAEARVLSVRIIRAGVRFSAY